MGEEKPKKKGPVTIAISLPWLAAGTPPPGPATAAEPGETASTPADATANQTPAAESGASIPRPTPDAPPPSSDRPPLAGLRAFLQKRQAQAQRTHDLFGDNVAQVEAELCRQLLTEQPGDRAAMTMLYRWCLDAEGRQRAAARNLWYGWHAAHGIVLSREANPDELARLLAEEQDGPAQS